MQARALFCGLYAHLAEPWVEKKLRPLLRSGVSIHVADGLSMNSDADAQFHEIFGRQFQEEACITCMLRGGVMPWDDYLRGRMSAAKVGLDTHLVFCSVISLFFGTKYCS